MHMKCCAFPKCKCVQCSTNNPPNGCWLRSTSFRMVLTLWSTAMSYFFLPVLHKKRKRVLNVVMLMFIFIRVKRRWKPDWIFASAAHTTQRSHITHFMCDVWCVMFQCYGLCLEKSLLQINGSEFFMLMLSRAHFLWFIGCCSLCSLCSRVRPYIRYDCAYFDGDINVWCGILFQSANEFWCKVWLMMNKIFAKLNETFFFFIFFVPLNFGGIIVYLYFLWVHRPKSFKHPNACRPYQNPKYQSPSQSPSINQTYEIKTLLFFPKPNDERWLSRSLSNGWSK